MVVQAHLVVQQVVVVQVQQAHAVEQQVEDREEAVLGVQEMLLVQQVQVLVVVVIERSLRLADPSFCWLKKHEQLLHQQQR